MSYLCSAWRTNFFTVKDRAAFAKAISMFEDVIKIEDNGASESNEIALFDAGDGGFPESYDTEDGEDATLDWAEAFKEHLVPEEGNVVVLTYTDYMGRSGGVSSTSGFSSAFNHKGEELTLSLEHIYDMIQYCWGIKKGTVSSQFD